MFLISSILPEFYTDDADKGKESGQYPEPHHDFMFVFPFEEEMIV